MSGRSLLADRAAYSGRVSAQLLAQTVAVALGGGLLSLSLPRASAPWLAYVGLVPLLLWCRRVSGVRSLWLGWICGFSFFLPVFYWIGLVMERYAGLTRPLSVVMVLLLTAYLACYPALFATLASFVNRRSPAWYWAAVPFLWVGVEMLRAHAVFGGFPWAELAYSQTPWPLMIQSADVLGAAGVNFLIVLCSAAVGVALERWWQESAGARQGSGNALTRLRLCATEPLVIGAAVLVLLNLGYGWRQWRAYAPELSDGSANNAAGLQVALLQGSIDQGQKWDPAFRAATMNIYAALSRQALGDGASLIVWPETALPINFAQPSATRQQFIDLVRSTGTYTVVGVPTVEKRQGSPRAYNSAYLISPNGAVVGRYDKQHLVPFGEYVPMSRLLSFAKKLTAGVGDFTPGRDAALMSVPGGRFAVLICFEIIFPELARRAAREGTEWFLNLTNDAWFGRTSAPYQHWAIGSLRAVETRRPIARAANTGISGWIDRRGVLHAGAGLFERKVAQARVQPRSTPLTVYVRLGDVFGWVCLGGTLAVALAALASFRGTASLRRTRTGRSAQNRA